MKKITSLVLVCALLVCTIFTLASCSMRFGKYESEINLGLVEWKVTYEFMGPMVTITTETDSLFGDSETDVLKGTFDIIGEGDDMEIVLDLDKGNDLVKSGAYSFSEGVENGVKYIVIGASRYEEVK